MYAFPTPTRATKTHACLRSEATRDYLVIRRDLLLSLPLGFVLSSHSRAQQRPKVIGLLSPFGRDEIDPGLDVFLRAMQDLGYIKGTHFVVVERIANGRYDRLPALAIELVKLNVDVICTTSTNGVAAAQAATTSIPIVFDSVSDPVQAGFANSLARPGHNMTGLSNFSGDLTAKRLQLLKQTMPTLTRVAVLSNSTNPNYASQLQRMQPAIQLGLQFALVSASTPEELEPAFRAMARERAEGVYVMADAYLWTQRRRIAELALRDKLPSVFASSDCVEAGGLMSYGVDPMSGMRQVATYVDKILKGAKAGDLPIEQPTRVELAINLRTADALRLTIPRTLLLQAEKVIE
jgi:putative ABC transport system substrate-binding protein